MNIDLTEYIETMISDYTHDRMFLVESLRNLADRNTNVGWEIVKTDIALQETVNNLRALSNELKGTNASTTL